MRPLLRTGKNIRATQVDALTISIIRGLITLSLFFSTLGCSFSGSVSDMLGQSLGDGKGSLSPSLVQISSSEVLVASSLLSSVGQSPAIPSQSAGLPALTATTNASNIVWGNTSSGSGVSSSGSGSSAAGGGILAVDAMASTSYTINVSITWPLGADPRCNILTPLSFLTCDLTSFILRTSDITSMTAAGGKLQLYAYDAKYPSAGLSSNQLNVVDFALRQVSDTSAGANDSFNALSTINNRLFALGTSIYRYDGDSKSFAAMTNINGTSDSARLPVAYNNKLMFFANSTAGGNMKLFSWNDSTEVLSQISNVHTGDNDFFTTDVFKNYVQANNKLYVFLNNPSYQYKLFEYSSPAETLIQVSNSNPTGGDIFGFLPDTMSVFEGKPVYRGLTSLGHCKVHWYDGTQTVQVSDINSGTCDDPSSFVDGGAGILYFYAGNSFLRWSPSAPGTITKVSTASVYSGASTVGVEPPILYNGKIFFVGMKAGYAKLMRYDPSLNTTTVITNIAGSSAPDDPSYFKIYNNKLFFVALNSSGKAKLFSYDDIGSGGLSQITDLSGGVANTDFALKGTTNPITIYTPYMTTYNNRLYFRANVDGSGSAKLFSYDDYSGKLYKVIDIRSSGNSDFDWTNTVEPVVYGKRLGLVMYNAAGYSKLYSLCETSAGCAP